MARDIREPGPRASKLELMGALAEAIRVSQNLSQRFDERAARRLGINTTDLRCLDAVERLGAPTAGELAEQAGLTSGTLTSVVDRLAHAGYVDRHADPDDRRRVRIALTDMARERLGAIWGPLAERYGAVMNGFTAAELRVVLRLMHRSEVVAWELMEQPLGDGDGDGANRRAAPARRAPRPA